MIYEKVRAAFFVCIGWVVVLMIIDENEDDGVHQPSTYAGFVLCGSSSVDENGRNRINNWRNRNTGYFVELIGALRELRSL